MAVAALALGACSGSSNDEGTDSTTEVETEEGVVTGDGQDDELPDSQVIESRDDLVDTSEGRVISVDEVGTDTLRVEYELGDPACFGAQVSAVETDDSVEVSVNVGTLPDVDAEDCEVSVGFYFTDIDLEAPLGSRTPRAAELTEPNG